MRVIIIFIQFSRILCFIPFRVEGLWLYPFIVLKPDAIIHFTVKFQPPRKHGCCAADDGSHKRIHPRIVVILIQKIENRKAYLVWVVNAEVTKCFRKIISHTFCDLLFSMNACRKTHKMEVVYSMFSLLTLFFKPLHLPDHLLFLRQPANQWSIIHQRKVFQCSKIRLFRFSVKILAHLIF